MKLRKLWNQFYGICKEMGLTKKMKLGSWFMDINLEINYFWFDFVESSYNVWDWEGFEIIFMGLDRN